MAATDSSSDNGIELKSPPLVELSDDLTARILLRLKPREIAAVALTCKRLAAICADDARIWQPLCNTVWLPHTNPGLWLQTGPLYSTIAGPSVSSLRLPRGIEDDDDDEDKPLTTYRAVFARLRRLQLLTGLWRGVGDAPTGSVFRVGWAAGRVAALEVVALRAGRGPDGVGVAASVGPAVVEESIARVGPAFPGLALQPVDEALAVLKDRPWKRDPRGAASPAGPPSAAALAAAAVATGGGGSGCEQLLGASPPRSFGYEMLRFMEASVAGRRSSGRKNRNRGAGGGGGGGGQAGSSPGLVVGPLGAGRQAQVLQHLVRLRVAVPGRKRPFCGVWTGVYGPHGLEIISVSYEGTGSRSRIVATKLTGDPNVPAGQTTFWVDAEPLPQPWPVSEVQLITNRPMYTSNPPAALEAALAAAAVAAAEPQDAGGAAPAPAAAAAISGRRGPPGVLATPLWAIPGVAEALAHGAAAALEGPDALLPFQQHLEALAAAASEADPVDLWDYLGPAPPPGLTGGQQRQRPGPTRVVAIFKGEGRVAGHNFTNPAWIEGRLWVYDNGSIGFLWRGDFDFLVDLERLSPQLLGRGGPSG